MFLWIFLILGNSLAQQENPPAESPPAVPAVLTPSSSPPPDPELQVLPLSAILELSVPPAPPDVDKESKCFSVWPHTCPPLSSTCRCRGIDNESVVCCHITSEFQLKEGLGCENVKNLSLTRIHLWNASLSNLDFFSRRGFTSVTVTDSSFEQIKLNSMSNVTCLNISRNSIGKVFPERDFEKLKNLKFLSLANISLSQLPRFPRSQNITLDLTGNLSLGCLVILQYMKDFPNVQFNNENATFCSFDTTLGWFNSTERITLSQVQVLRDIEEDCVPGCKCKAVNLNMVPGKLNHYSLQVNCSSIDLEALPPNLPPHASHLDVSNNSIKTLDGFHQESYKSVLYFFADSNQISSILPLESTSFIAGFQRLSLRNNKISSLQTYILNSAFDRNVGSEVFLGGNRLTCNCSVAQGVKIWLIANRKYVKDSDEIYCNNMMEKVIDLDPNKVCVYDRDWTDYIYFIIAGEVALLLLLVGKVSYDYWVFKTAGYLPWPASKMPKLPCDWVFE